MKKKMAVMLSATLLLSLCSVFGKDSYNIELVAIAASEPYSVDITDDNTVIIGDVNADGVFSVSDVVLFQKWLLAVPDTYLSNWKAADFCDDDVLNVFDLTLMKRTLIERINIFAENVQYEAFSYDYPYYNTVPDLASKANQVFSGRVKNISFEMLDMQTMQPLKDGEGSQWAMLFTVYEIEAEEVYAGSPNIVKLRIEGGISSGYEKTQIALLGNERIPVMVDLPALTIGTKYLFALYHADDSEYSSILNPLQSIYTESAEQTGGFSAEEIISYFS